MNNEWITDRLPTREDAVFFSVWVWSNGELSYRTYDKVDKGQPWRRITVPEPYEKPIRFWPSQEFDGTFSVETRGPNMLRVYRLGLPTFEAAKEVAEVFERVMP